METWRKVVRLGTTAREGDVFAKIEVRPRQHGREGTELGISGVVGPTHNGDCRGGAGQIVMSRPKITTYAPGWSAELVAQFWETWDRWHLNDMRAGCEHQRVTWDPSAELELVTYRLNSESWKAQDAIKARALAALQGGATVTLTEEERALLALPWETLHAPDADGPGSGRYDVQKRETKLAGWVYPKEHPGGLLTKPCEVCGHKYGSGWLYEPIPADVLAFLRSLPDTDVTPAWV